MADTLGAVRSNSFDVNPGAHPVQPPVPCVWGDPRCMTSPREGECDPSISSCQGLIRAVLYDPSEHCDPGNLITRTLLMGALFGLGVYTN